MRNLLALENLQTTFRTREGEVHAVRGVSFQVQPGELVGIVGESGCGKSVTCKSIIQLLGSNGRITGGSIRFQNDDLAQKNARADARHSRQRDRDDFSGSDDRPEPC